jgi:hypothetical protein
MGKSGGAGFGLFNGGLSTGSTATGGKIGSTTYGGIVMGGNDTHNLIIIGGLVLVIGFLVFKK